MVFASRRWFLLSSFATLFAGASKGRVEETPTIHVVKGRGCECCDAWVDYLRAEGFSVTDEISMGTLQIRYKMDLGIPTKAFSCHTGLVTGYALEGHIPAADIRRLLEERPDAIGLAVPGMPYGSPGMGSEDTRVVYEVLLIRRDGSLQTFQSYPAR